MRLFASDFVSAGRNVMSKQQLEEAVRANFVSHGNGPSPVTIEKKNMAVYLFGDTAVVTYIPPLGSRAGPRPTGPFFSLPNARSCDSLVGSRRSGRSPSWTFVLADSGFANSLAPASLLQRCSKPLQLRFPRLTPRQSPCARQS
jgi:hypothetical protein